MMKFMIINIHFFTTYLLPSFLTQFSLFSFLLNCPWTSRGHDGNRDQNRSHVRDRIRDRRRDRDCLVMLYAIL